MIKKIVVFLLVFSLFSTASAHYRKAKKKDTTATAIDSTALTKLSKKIGFYIDSQDKNIALYQEAVKWLGVRYKRGGMGLSGADCSGLTSLIYLDVFEIRLPRCSTDIANSTKKITKKQLHPGDLVFFSTRRRKRINHVGVYLGDNRFVHASCHRGVIISSLEEDYYRKAFRKGGRVENGNKSI